MDTLTPYIRENWFGSTLGYVPCLVKTARNSDAPQYMKEIIMFLRHAFLGTTLFALMSSTAMADPATPEEAARLVALFQTYIGAEPGVVSVEPAGDAYTVTLDFAPFIAKASPDTFTGTVTPYVMTITDNGDGTWATATDQAFEASFTAAGISDFSYKMASLKGTGVFDEALSAFTSSRSDFTDISFTQTVTIPDTPPSTSSTSATSGFYESEAVSGAEAGVDSKVTYALTGYTQTMAIPGAPGAPAADVTIEAESYGGDATLTGFDPAAFYKLIAWFVAHPSKEAIKADQAGLKALLTEGMPFFQNINITGGMQNATITTPVGVFNVATVGIDMEANGLVDDGLFREGITLSGLTIPDGLAPEWSAGLVPEDLAFDVTVSGFNAASPVAAVIAAFDLTKPEPIDPTMQGSLMAAFMPNGAVDIELAPGSVSSDMYNLTYEGAMTAGPGSMPVGKATVTMTGMEAVLAALQAAPPEVSGQIVPVLGMAKGMATPGEEGALVWDIDASVPGTLMVNGTDLMMMMGGQ